MLAIIPARGGSKGLANKNIKLLNGKPLICYSIEAALECSYITHVVVSTDSPAIAKIAKEAGAWVPSLRPAELATDDAESIHTYIYTLELLDKEYGISFEELIVLQPTSPLRSAEDIHQAIGLFYEKNADSVISYTREHHPIYWHKKIEKDNRITTLFEDHTLTNRQQYPVTYYPNGSLYIFKSELILKYRSYYRENSFAYIMPKNRSIDIDDMDDFNYAEFLLGIKNS